MNDKERVNKIDELQEKERQLRKRLRQQWELPVRVEGKLSEFHSTVRKLDNLFYKDSTK